MGSGTTVLPLRALLAGKEEDRFTEVLAHLLRDGRVLHQFLTRVCGLTNLPTHLSAFTVATRISFDGGTPDLVIEGPRYFLLFEAKVASGLHEDQLRAYANALTAHRPGERGVVRRLWLIVRSRDRALIAREALRQLEGTGIVAHVLTWEAIGHALSASAARHPEARMQHYLRDFGDVIEWGIGSMPRPFTPRETALLASGAAAEAYENLRRLMVQLSNRLEGLPSVEVGRVARGAGWDGYSVVSRKRWWWVGLWPAAWPSTQRSPLVLQLPGFRQGDRVPPRLAHPVPFKTVTEEGFLVPLIVRPGEEVDVLVDEFAAVVSRWSTECPRSGGTGGKIGE